MKRISVLFLLISIFTLSLNAKVRPADKILTYKTVDNISLKLHMFYPPGEVKETLPAIVFFYGGGWVKKGMSQFERQAVYFAKRGIVAILADYRTKNPNKTTPFDAVSDAKSAIRYLKANANKLNIDSSKIIAAGGSAGGHLAAATALINSYDDPSDNLSISSKPQALVLYNPVIDNSENGYGYERIGDEYKSFSPLHNIRKDAPPTIIFLGTKDKYIPVETIKEYQRKMSEVGSLCKVYLYNNQQHGFFNFKREPRNPYFSSTLYETDLFLISLGYLTGKPTVKRQIKADAVF